MIPKKLWNALYAAESDYRFVKAYRKQGVTGRYTDADERGFREAVEAAREALLNAAKKPAWDEGYVAGNAFGYEWAQDTYDGPAEDPTNNPYEEVTS